MRIEGAVNRDHIVPASVADPAAHAEDAVPRAEAAVANLKVEPAQKRRQGPPDRSLGFGDCSLARRDQWGQRIENAFL